jgi:hypothetical protein
LPGEEAVEIQKPAGGACGVAVVELVVRVIEGDRGVGDVVLGCGNGGAGELVLIDGAGVSDVREEEGGEKEARRRREGVSS